MPIRPATYADLLPSSKILGRAFKDEHLFSKYMHPRLSQHPEDMYLYFLRSIRLAYTSGPDHHLLVSYHLDSETSQEIVTGFAHWERDRANPSTSYLTTAKIKAMTTYNYLESFVYPNRAAEPSRLDVLQRNYPFVQHFWTGSRADVWSLYLIGVDPACHGQGIGQELVKYGFDRAKEEGVGCSVVSAENKEGFYQKCGFDVIVGTCRDHGGQENPLIDVPGGTVLFWDNGRDVSGVKRYGEC